MEKNKSISLNLDLKFELGKRRDNMMGMVACLSIAYLELMRVVFFCYLSCWVTSAGVLLSLSVHL